MGIIDVLMGFGVISTFFILGFLFPIATLLIDLFFFTVGNKYVAPYTTYIFVGSLFGIVFREIAELSVEFSIERNEEPEEEDRKRERRNPLSF